MKLRVGNLCYFEHENIKEEVIIAGYIGDYYLVKDDAESLDLRRVSYSDLKPIPINEWNIGILDFVQKDYLRTIWDVKQHDAVLYMNGQYEVWKWSDYCSWCFRKRDATFVLKVHYVHEVQNLIEVLNDL
ncbi:MAG: hypothetical protein IIW86_06825 [Clostridia bacterium]|nr:hypothetical protein [Clostridia bacterium]